jgi:hypothetical protein
MIGIVGSCGLSICRPILRYGLDLFDLASLALCYFRFFFAVSRRFRGDIVAGGVVRQLAFCEPDGIFSTILRC